MYTNKITIIVTGPVASGKTTLISKLSTALINLDIKHRVCYEHRALELREAHDCLLIVETQETLSNLLDFK